MQAIDAAIGLDHSSLPQSRNRLLVVAELRQDLVGVLAQRLESGAPITWARMHPSRVRKMSTGAAAWPRFPVGTRLGAITACSISSALPKVTAVARRAPSTIWPLPVTLRAISAAMVPKA